VTSAQETIDAYLDELAGRGYAAGTRRLRSGYLTEYLQHALATEDTPLDLTAEQLMEPQRAAAWYNDAQAGLTRQRNTLHGPQADAAQATQRSRAITYNLFSAWLGLPHQLELPPVTTGEHLDPEDARTVIHDLSVRRPNGANAATTIRTAALAALVAATGRTVTDLASLDTADLQLDRPQPRLLLEDAPAPLDAQTVQIVRRWLRQRAGITAALTGLDPGYLWIPTKQGRPRAGRETPPPGARRAAVRTLHDAHRRLVYSLLGRPVRPGAFRVT
jgi:integrase